MAIPTIIAAPMIVMIITAAPGLDDAAADAHREDEGEKRKPCNLEHGWLLFSCVQEQRAESRVSSGRLRQVSKFRSFATVPPHSPCGRRPSTE
jgi:hypothetical protein